MSSRKWTSEQQSVVCARTSSAGAFGKQRIKNINGYALASFDKDIRFKRYAREPYIGGWKIVTGASVRPLVPPVPCYRVLNPGSVGVFYPLFTCSAMGLFVNCSMGGNQQNRPIVPF